MESFSETKNLARVKAGFGGGNRFGAHVTRSPMRFVEGHPSEVLAKFKASAPKQSKPGEGWGSRR